MHKCILYTKAYNILNHLWGKWRGESWAGNCFGVCPDKCCSSTGPNRENEHFRKSKASNETMRSEDIVYYLKKKKKKEGQIHISVRKHQSKMKGWKFSKNTWQCRCAVFIAVSAFKCLSTIFGEDWVCLQFSSLLNLCAVGDAVMFVNIICASWHRKTSPIPC